MRGISRTVRYALDLTHGHGRPGPNNWTAALPTRAMMLSWTSWCTLSSVLLVKELDVWEDGRLLVSTISPSCYDDFLALATCILDFSSGRVPTRIWQSLFACFFLRR